MLKGTIKLNDQECEDTLNFHNTEKYMTKGFSSTFGDEANEIYQKAIDLIMEQYPNNADRFQTLTYTLDNEEIRFWLIVDDYGNGRYVLTALLPEEY